MMRCQKRKTARLTRKTKDGGLTRAALESAANFRWLGGGRTSPPLPALIPKEIPASAQSNRRSEQREAAIESSQAGDFWFVGMKPFRPVRTLAGLLDVG